MRTLYDLLDVRSDADDDALTKAYRKAAKAHHPDLNAGDSDAPRRFRQITTAIEILRNAEQRAAYDRWLESERQQEHQRRRWNRTVIADAIAAAVVIVVVVMGYTLIGPTFSTSTMVSKGENSAEPGPVAIVAEQPSQRTEPTGGDEPRSRLSKQSAAAEREAPLAHEQEERRPAAEFERQTAEREAPLTPEQEERRRAGGRERQKAERELERRQEHRARQLAAGAEAARSAMSTPSEPAQGTQTTSSAASSRSFGPVEIAATRAFARF